MDRKSLLLKIIVAISYFVMMVFSTYALMQPINGESIQTIALSYPNSITPLDAFQLIWILIFILVGMFVIYQFDFRHNASKQVGIDILQSAQMFFIAYCWLEIIWIIAWIFEYIALSLIILLTMLLCSRFFCRLICTTDLSARGIIFIKLPSSILYGWLTNTFVMNLVILLVSIRWQGWGIPLPIWAAAALAVTAIYAAIRTYRNRDVIYCLAVLWGYIGVLLRHIIDFRGQYASIIIVVACSMVFLVGSVVLTVVNKKSSY